MENYIQNIELINRYLNQRLSEKESKAFEDRMSTETDLKDLYEEHIVFLEGLKRQSVKGEIKKAKQSHIRNKWFKYFGFISIVVVLFTIIYFNAFNSDKEYLKNKLNFESKYIQNFQVAVDSIIEIVGEKGTVIQFNPKDLETSSKKPFVADSLSIELIELINKQDLLLANAETVSNGKWLVSGGAFKIDIRVNGKPLVLKEGKTINVQFPKNTLEDGMQIFYGARDEENNMNWDLSNINLVDEKYNTILYRDSTVLDEELTKTYMLDMFKKTILVDSLGYLEKKNIIEKFPGIEEIKIDNDTLRIYDITFYNLLYEDSIADDLLGDVELLERKYISISKSQAENVIKNVSVDYFIEQGAFDLYDKVANRFYESVDVSKLGWINIDKFARDEEKVSVKFNFNVKTNHNEIYIVDQKNNTVLNVCEDNIDLPINRSFYVIAIGIKGKDIYGFKKSVRFSKSDSFKIDFKKINKSQIKSILTLENSISTSDSVPKNANKLMNLDSISNQNIEQFEERKVYNQAATKSKEEGVFKYSKDSQVFKINTKKDTTINCKEGTKLIIKSNSFVDSKGNLVKGNLDLNVTEYYKLSDMLLANLTTQSNDKQLETGGMLHIEAFRGDELLNLKQNSSIGVSFPAESKKEDMRLFTGKWEDENINWRLQEKQKPEIDDLLAEVIEVAEDDSSENIEVPFSIVEQVPVYPGCEEGDNKKQRQCTSDAIKRFVQREFNRNVAEELGFNGRVRINVIFRINENGDVVSIQSRANYPRFEEEAKRVIGLLPKMKPGMQRGNAVTVPYSLPIIFQIDGQSEFTESNGSVSQTIKTRETISNKRFENKLTLKNNNVRISEVNSYILRTSKLGWINCDRFIRNRSRINYKLKIKNSEGAIVNMVFKTVNCIMPSWKNNEVYDFRTIPKGEEVVLVAIKKNGEKLFFDIIETKTKENPMLDFNFKEITFEELKIHLEKLNKAF
ncbi:energy transducer TonB [Flavivirga abyssicola]|uniref:energy transducer TonB n=1 Tax=Flavivirga abyssicola TaxID=3063533 RepID=UPI0026E0AAAF|nr:energy transducer TonB [Flavivirga sp. MEBiC07777]WVK14674.1 energy transducer TonB [Flavivirga sp. MEBiC07777]